jgi:hypothetical protein
MMLLPSLLALLVYSVLLWLPLPTHGTLGWSDGVEARTSRSSGTPSHPEDKRVKQNVAGAVRRKHRRRRTTAHDTSSSSSSYWEEDVVFEASVAGGGMKKKAKSGKAAPTAAPSPAPAMRPVNRPVMLVPLPTPTTLSSKRTEAPATARPSVAMATRTTTADPPPAPVAAPVSKPQHHPADPVVGQGSMPAPAPPPSVTAAGHQQVGVVVGGVDPYRTIHRSANATSSTDETKSFCETPLPVAASPLVDAVLYFRYTLTLPADTNEAISSSSSPHASQLPAIEDRIHQELATRYLADCLFYDKTTTFSVLSLSSAPPDQVDEAASTTTISCGPHCRHISGALSMTTFYILNHHRHRRRLMMDDPIVAESFGRELRYILARLSADPSTGWKMEFLSLAPLAVNDEAPVFENRDNDQRPAPSPPNVAASIQESSPQQRHRAALPWGMSFLGLAAVTLLVVSIMSIRHRRQRRRRLRTNRDDQAGLHETYLKDQDRYTYDGGDGVQYLVNDDLMLDTEEGIEAVNRPWTANIDDNLHHDNEAMTNSRPPKYVQVQRAYEAPDTVDL